MGPIATGILGQQECLRTLQVSARRYRNQPSSKYPGINEAAAAVMREVGKQEQYTCDYKANVKIFHVGNHYAADRTNVVQGMKQETYLKHKVALDEYDRAKTSYDAAKKAYDKAIAARKDIVRDVNDYVDACRDILREERLIHDTMTRYIRCYSRFKAEYRTKADAVKARQAWEEKGRILFPEDMKKATVKVEAKPAMRRSGTTYQQEMRL